MPAEERLGRASPPLSVWFRAAAPEEIKNGPDVVLVWWMETNPASARKRRETKSIFCELYGNPNPNKTFPLFTLNFALEGPRFFRDKVSALSEMWTRYCTFNGNTEEVVLFLFS